MNQSQQTEKSLIRARMRHLRNMQAQTDQLKHSLSLCQKFAKHPQVATAQSIAIYSPMFGEVSPLSLLSLLPAQFYLPVIQSDKTLLFAPYNNQSQMIKNSFNIPEPVVNKNTLVYAEEIDIICLPLLAATQEGIRLGMGGGFYDRTLAFIFNNTVIKRPRLIGFAYDFQLLDTLPSDRHDIKLDSVFTP